MALFTDEGFVGIEDLRGHDSQLLNVATVEGIDVTRKLALAHDEVAIGLEGLLDQLRTMTGIYEAPGLNSAPRLRQVVLTAPLKLWHVYRTLEMVYADAYNSQLNDRYAGKRDEYREMAKWAYNQVIRAGLGIVTDPMQQADTPVLQTAAGGLTSGAYYVAVTWTNAAGEEGASSAPAMIQVTGTSFTAQTTAPPEIKGWNVYCGTSASAMRIQNATILAPGQSWLQPDTMSTTGRPAGDGQTPTYLLPVPRTIQRG